MFQRFKGFNLDSFLDNKIAEEQAKQQRQSSPGSAKRTPSDTGPRRNNTRTGSPSRRAGSRLRAAEGASAPEAAGKGPDPEEFVIGDDASDISRVATPRPVKESAEGPLGDAGESAEKQDVDSPPVKKKERADDDEMPEDVRKKLARLESLTNKYQDLLRNYRTAHARVSAIEPFEATLREHTPLTSISDPGALVEFLNQRGLQSDMVLEELKRITGEHKDVLKERDELKVKLDEAEKKAKEAFDGAAGLLNEREGRSSAPRGKRDVESDPLGVNGVNNEAESLSKPEPEATGDDEFFSYETEQKKSLEDELKEHQVEIKQQKEYINELSTENASLHQSLDMCQLDLEAMKNKISIKDREINNTQTQLEETTHKLEDAAKAREEAQEQEQEAAALLAQTEGEVVHLQDRLKEYQKNLSETHQELQEKAALAEENLKKYQKEHDENLKSGKYTQREEKGLDTLRNLVNTLRDQAREAEKAKTQAEDKAGDLHVKLQKMMIESAHAEDDREEAARLTAETKKGHEAAAATLRGQLKRAEKDRDAAYQMILDCGKCELPDKAQPKAPATPTETSSLETGSRVGSETTELTEASTQATELSTPSVEGDTAAGGGKKPKKNKKKSKAKKTASEDPSAPLTTEQLGELVADPTKARSMFPNREDSTMMLQALAESLENRRMANDEHDEGREAVLRHHEQVMEEQTQKINDAERTIREKDGEISVLRESIGKKVAAIESLDKKLKDQDALVEEVDFLRNELSDIGNVQTEAKHEAKTAKEAKQKLQEEFDELQAESDRNRKTLKDAEAQRNDLASRCSTLETEIVELKKSQASTSASEEEVRGVREQLEQVQKEKESVQLAKAASEKQIEELKLQHTATGAELDAKHKSLSADFDELKVQASGLEKDLAAANHLAQTRFKDLTDLKEHINKIQPELKKLREETAELKNVKTDMEKSSASVKRLEAKEKDLRSEIAEYKFQATGKDGEIAALKDKASESDARSAALEESYENARKDLEKSQGTRDEAVETRDKLQADLKKVEEELRHSRSSLGDLEKQVRKLSDEASTLRDELQMKSAQQASSQSLMDSMQDQTRELATQMKEVRERNESVEEELADAHRLLSERSREGETMRRMLAEVEGRAESRVKEMRERMDLATEERDRAEDEASGIGRRKAREIEEMKTKLREAEREASRAAEERGAAERREREFQTRAEGLEKRAAQAQEELAEVRTAMAQLRDALDESERQARELEKEKADVSKAIEEREARLQKLQKSSKSMAEELRSLQQGKPPLRQGSVQSTRSSMDSSSQRVTSPAPARGGGGAPASNGSGDAAQPREADFFYLKNVLLQFLQQKEKKHQMQMIHPLGQLLHFDKQDQQRWEAAISSMR